MNPTRRRLICLSAMSGALSGLSTARAQSNPANPALIANQGISRDQILIGQVISLEGGRNEHGVAVRQGVEAALREVELSGPIHGRKLVLRVMDDAAKAAEAEARARELASQGVFMFFGSIEGGPSNAVMKVANETQRPFFGPMAGSPTLRRPHQPLVFPVRAEHREEFRVLLTQARNLGMRKVAFLQSDSDVGRLHLENLRAIANTLGMSVLLPMPFGSDVSDAMLLGFVRQMREKQVDVVLNHGSSGLYERLIRSARSEGLTIPFFGINSGSAQLARHLGPLAQGMVFTQVVPSPWERKTELTRNYQAAFKAAFRDQDFSYGSLEGYVTTLALAESLKKVGRDLSVASYLRAMADAQFDLAGYKMAWRTGDHAGSAFIDTAIVTREGRFKH
ncbi:ABC transporter substrate-binding protein [Ideonella sp.]|uniref:ABC transporter substrate-binding protein n=1 Tax=Ideonella sp. TaxID=1929293 RepID=UPI003BB4BD35